MSSLIGFENKLQKYILGALVNPIIGEWRWNEATVDKDSKNMF